MLISCHFRENLKIDLDVSNFATKSNQEKAAGYDRSAFVKKIDTVSVISRINKLDINN